jgi:hypothetical protein
VSKIDVTVVSTGASTSSEVTIALTNAPVPAQILPPFTALAPWGSPNAAIFPQSNRSSTEGRDPDVLTVDAQKGETDLGGDSHAPSVGALQDGASRASDVSDSMSTMQQETETKSTSIVAGGQELGPDALTVAALASDGNVGRYAELASRLRLTSLKISQHDLKELYGFVEEPPKIPFKVGGYSKASTKTSRPHLESPDAKALEVTVKTLMGRSILVPSSSVITFKDIKSHLQGHPDFHRHHIQSKDMRITALV